MRLPPSASRVLAAALAGLLLGACGGTLHDAAGVPALPPGGGGATCDAPQHVCGEACVAQSVAACGTGCDACTAGDPNATAVCEPGASGAFACGQVCQPGWFACAAGCCRATAVAAGDEHACAVTSDGALLCWGKNDAGQLGPGAAGLLRSVRPVAVPLTSVTAVSAGGQHTCALRGSGAGATVSCWGANGSGQLGGGTTTATAAIVENALPGATMLALGGRHSCAVVGGGAVKCWGSNDKGQLGNGTLVGQTSPVASLVSTGATSLSAAGDDTCVVASGAASCWGADLEGQTGSGAIAAGRATPQPIGISGSALQVATGRKHTCATSSSGGTPLFCWGSGGEGEIGNGLLDTPVLSPQQALVIDNGQRAAIFAAGEAFTCTAKVGEVSMNCNGRNDLAQCGVAPTSTPVLDRRGPAFGGPVLAASAGRAFACALVDLGPRVVMCWGANAEGQLGRATPASAPSFSPDLVGK